MPEEAKNMAKTRLASRLQWVDGELAKTSYLMGDNFTVADGYLFTVSNWAQYVGIDLSIYPNLLTFRSLVSSRPNVIEAMKAEGLIK
jgi:glutathione S-transferase